MKDCSLIWIIQVFQTGIIIGGYFAVRGLVKKNGRNNNSGS